MTPKAWNKFRVLKIKEYNNEVDKAGMSQHWKFGIRGRERKTGWVAVDKSGATWGQTKKGAITRFGERF